MADAMPPPNADALLAEIDRLAEALPCPQRRRGLAVLRAQLALLVREAGTGPDRHDRSDNRHGGPRPLGAPLD
jgi:hypothetical protein